MQPATSTGWHRADIVAAVRKRGSTLRQLALANGFAESTLRASLGIRHPKAHTIIAEFIGVSPSDIWPQFYAAPDVSSSVEMHSTARRPASSQKRKGART